MDVCCISIACLPFDLPGPQFGPPSSSGRKFKNAKLAADPSWTLEKEMAMKRGVEYVPPPPKVISLA